MIEAIASFMKISPRLATRVANRADPVDHGTPGALRAVSDTSTMQEPPWFVEDMGRNGHPIREQQKPEHEPKSRVALKRMRSALAQKTGKKFERVFKKVIRNDASSKKRGVALSSIASFF
jgi:hypothetical protein